MDYKIRFATGLQPGLVWQIARDLERGDESILIPEDLYELIEPTLRPYVDSYGVTTVTAQQWRLIALNIRDVAAQDGADPEASASLQKLADWLILETAAGGPLTVYGV